MGISNIDRVWRNAPMRADQGRVRTCLRMASFAFLLFASCLFAQTPGRQTSVEPVAREGAANAAESMHFRDVSQQAGLTTVPHSSVDRHYIVETMGGGGIALFDCDNDGRLDIAVVNDTTIDRYLAGGDPMITLYHQDGNQGQIHFTDITKAAGLTTRGWGMAIAVGDYDNDGLPDLYVTGYGHNVLYHNLGGCRFEDVSDRAGVKLGGFSTGAAWADYDRDGYLDLFVARYVQTDLHHLPIPEPNAVGYRSVILQVPAEMEGETDVLLRNRGNGTFEDVSQKAGVNNPAKLHGMGVVWGDYDNDGWPDLFVTNDGGRNYLYHNQHNGTFAEEGIVTGVAFGADGEIFGNMAGDFGDFNRDGRLDLITTRYSGQPVSLYRNDRFAFTDVASEVGLARDTVRPVKWGTGFGDLDNDGWPDVLIANGNFSSLMDQLQGEVTFREPMQLFRNIEGRSFEDVADQAGLNTGPLQSRRGIGFGDVNNDGNLDFVVFNADRPPSLFLNETRNGNHRVLFRLVGRKSNRMAIGARVTIQAGGMTQIDEVRGGGGYNSSSDTRLHFGLGKAAIMSTVSVRWPSGLHQEFQNVSADVIYEIEEGQAIHKLMTLPPPSGQ
ncbi:MAG TPA: CRTAC1 family protein [Acidobacteriaceae bacterium]|nr:CRTAC1 family protein [Acidobacteriaceae bacterium]